MASSTINRWLRPEVYPLFAAVGVAVGICGFQLVRNICGNPEVRVTKERGAGLLGNFQKERNMQSMLLGSSFVTGLQRLCRLSPEIMPSISGFFSDPK